MVEVTQADREAYLEWNAGGRLPCGQDERDAVLSGDLDDNRLLQAFAAHHEAGRRAGLEEAAGVARKIGQCSNATGRADCCEHTAEDIEGAIRAKIGDGHD